MVNEDLVRLLTMTKKDDLNGQIVPTLCAVSFVGGCSVNLAYLYRLENGETRVNKAQSCSSFFPPRALRIR